MNLVLPDVLILGLSREANARGVSIETLVATTLRLAIQDRLFDAIIDDAQLDRTSSPRPEKMRIAEPMRRRTLHDRKARILEVLANSATGWICLRDVDERSPQLWTRAFETLLQEGRIRRETRKNPNTGWPCYFYTRAQVDA